MFQSHFCMYLCLLSHVIQQTYKVGATLISFFTDMEAETQGCNDFPRVIGLVSIESGI